MKKILYLILGIGFILVGFMYMLGSIYESEATSLSTPDIISLSPPNIGPDPDDTGKNLLGHAFGPTIFGIGIFFLSKTRERKRGQISMEFLMTYGWAILAAIISITVLALFGVFNPEQLASSSAIVTQPFYVNTWNVQETAPLSTRSGVLLELRNNGGQSLEVISITIEGKSGIWVGQCSYTSPIITIGDGKSSAITIPCGALGPVLFTGDTFKGDITITYRKPGSNLEITSTGTIIDTVIP